MPGGVGFGGQHGVELGLGEFGDDGVGEDAGGVDDCDQSMLGGDGLQQCGQLGGIAGIAGGESYVCAEIR
ncbi:hypothetical protein MSIMFI_05356 [Mycobacterium simulans]|nr:hypothetical protein MSIMFI_05356 [Mycobacterium simulans]